MATVASATHLALWMRKYPRGIYTKVRATRRFAVITLALFAVSFLLGNLLYPTYKVRVRAQFLDAPSAVALQEKARRLENERGASGASQQPGSGISAPSPSDSGESSARSAAKMARWFDVKEHWVALGLALISGVTALLFLWRPKEHPPAVPTAAFLMSIGVAVVAWGGAIVGLLVSSFRAIG